MIVREVRYGILPMLRRILPWLQPAALVMAPAGFHNRLGDKESSKVEGGATE